MELENLIKLTQEKIGVLIPKPKMTEKLLQKPPFRFLHDTISAILSTTGFGEGLYDEQERDSSTITEKQAKLNYLEKIFNLIGICQGTKLAVLSSKVVAGLEPENTNLFLIALADCAVNSNIDSEVAVRRCLSGEVPGSGVIPLRRKDNQMSPSTLSEAKEVSPRQSLSDQQLSKPIERTSSQDRESKISEAKQQFTSDPSAVASTGAQSNGPGSLLAAERGVSRSGTRGGKPTTQASTVDNGLTGIVSGNKGPANLDAFIEQCDGSESATQILLGEIISRPKLTSKLLQKPPFRFLHDIITEVIRSTGFAKGLYTDDEMESSKVTEKQQKLDFLDKIIRLVGVQLNTLVEAKSSKIVAGLDAQVTNNLLQLIAVAAKHMPSSDKAVCVVLNGVEPAGSVFEGAQSSAKPQTPAVAEEKSTPRNPPMQSDVVIAQEPLKRVEAKSTAVSREPQRERKDLAPSSVEARMDAQSDPKPAATPASLAELIGAGSRSTRPTTAGRRPPKVKEAAAVSRVEVDTNDATAVGAIKKPHGVILDNQADEAEENDEIVEDQSSAARLADEFVGLGAGGGTGSLDGGANVSDAAVQSKLVQDILTRQAEQEAAQARAQSKDAEARVDQSKDDQGGGGIRLTRKSGPGQNVKSTDRQVASGQGATGVGQPLSQSSAAGGAQYDVGRFRASVQALVQCAAPLGGSMDFLLEDAETMAAELRKWEDEARRYELKLTEERELTRTTLRPLERELAELGEQIQEKMSMMSTVKSNLARNSDRLLNLYRSSSTVQ